MTKTIQRLKTQLYQSLVAPIDAMWEQRYIAESQHYLIRDQNQIIGFCCITKDKCLIQLFLQREHLVKMDEVCAELVHLKLIASASLSSNEPRSFNACLLLCKSLMPNTFCFEHVNCEVKVDRTLPIEMACESDIPSIKVFLKEQVGMEDTFGYTANLVARKELFMVRDSDNIIATSECRFSDSQPSFADLGIIVRQANRGQGIATQIMKMQANRVIRAGRKPICSTTFDNIASKKAIERSGFYCSNVIFDMNFSDRRE